MASFNGAYSLPIQPFPSHALPVVDLIFPGVSSAARALQTILAARVNDFATLVAACGLVTFIAKYLCNYIRKWIEEHYTSSVRLSDNNEVRDMLDAWMAANLLDATRTSCVRVGGSYGLYAMEDGSFDKPKKPLQFVQGHGTYWFRFEGTWFQYRNIQEPGPFGTARATYITCFGRRQGPLRVFLDACRKTYLTNIAKKTLIYENRNGTWQKARARTIRRLETVILDKKIKNAWINDIEQFLRPETRAQYVETGTPWKRGYLLYGPPGTGKTSATLALANHFGADVYKLNIGACAESSELGKLLNDIPEGSLLLAEDIDAIETVQKRDVKGENEHPNGITQRVAKEPPTNISLSDILNMIDGVASVEGLLLFLTTNHPEKLDPALVRPGRIDRKIELGRTTSEMNHELFYNFYKRAYDDDESAGTLENYIHKIDTLATAFAEKLPQNRFSPAEVLSLFQEYMRSPQDAVEGVERWMAKLGKAESK